jgi:CDP-diacylglycerol--glycerol-3-phosphate 3-phosphatidyltransferase
MRHLPNILTLFRIVLTVFFVVFLTRQGFVSMILAAVFFAAASITDYFDGYLAKKKNLVTDFGKIMDPIADKVLILAAFFIFARMDIIAVWMFVVIFLREFLVTMSRFKAMRKGRVLAAEKAGKLKTVSQITAISVVLVFLILRESSLASQWSDGMYLGWRWGVTFLMLITVVFTVLSGVSYYNSYRKTVYV